MGGRRGGNHTEIEGTTTVVGIIGDAVRGSLSPRLHNAAFAALGLNWCYVAFPVTRDRLGEALRGLPALGIAGVNVTAPHKEAALAYLDETTDEARAIGAVNTIRVASDRLLGHNTDTAGLLDALSCDGGLAVEGRRCVIVGAGGAARAAAFALAGAVRRAFSCSADAAPLDGSGAAAALREATLLVQATTLGGGAQRALSPIPAGMLHPDLFVMDMIYEPRETVLLREARAAGCRTLGGLPMLIYQGAKAFEIWTGHAAPLDVMRRAVAPAGGPAPKT